MKIILKQSVVILAFAVGLAGIESCGCESQCDSSVIERVGTGSPSRLLGTFIFRQLGTIDTPFRNGIIMELEFTPDPTGVSGSACDVGFIQIVRTVSLKDPTRFYYPTSQKARRATSQGWYIDQADGYESPLYGRNNSGFPPDFEPALAQPGRMAATTVEMAHMADRPSRREYPHLRCILWQAVTVPVCISDHVCPKTLGDKVDGLGYYTWSWIVTEDGEVAEVQHDLARSSFAEQVDEALKEWNGETIWGTLPCPPRPVTTSK